MTTGEKIKMLREQRGYTLEQLGKKVGVGKSTVRKWETGFIENMGRDKIASLADVFGVSPNYFILEDEKMPTTPKDGEREEEYEEFYRNVFSKLSQENVDFLIAQGQFLLNHQKSQDGQE